MVKALFLDFYGTVVHEDGEIIREITKIIMNTGGAGSTEEIGRFWWSEFQGMCEKAHGESFETQRALEQRSLENTIERFGSDAGAAELSGRMFDYWMNPDIFEDSKAFFERCPVPIYVVSNIDRQDIRAAMDYHGLSPAGVFTSEDARAYKPREELFRLALESTGLGPKEAVHIGDSLSSDVRGAGRAGIPAVWLNRGGRDVPQGVRSAGSLLDILQMVFGG